MNSMAIRVFGRYAIVSVMMAPPDSCHLADDGLGLRLIDPMSDDFVRLWVRWLSIERLKPCLVACTSRDIRISLHLWLARISHRHLSIRRKWVLRAMVRHGWDEQGTTVKLRAGFRGIVDSKWPSFGGNRCD